MKSRGRQASGHPTVCLTVEPEMVDRDGMRVSTIAAALIVCAASATPQTTPPALIDDHGYGPVEPAVPIPNVRVTRHDGVEVGLAELMRGRLTAVQFVFMDCQTACPLLGSLFRNVERKLGPNAENVALLSITVNPGRDTPARLAEWLKRYQASPRWSAVRAEPAALREIQKAFNQQQDGPPSGHTLQVFFADREARYIARTVKLPQAPRVAAALLGKTEMAGRGSVPLPETGPGKRPASAKTDATGEELYNGTRPLRGHIGGDELSPVSARCVNCHGETRAGATEGKIAPSPLTAAALTIAHPRRGGPASRYTEDSFCTSLRTGVDPAGVLFASAMPRYELSVQECQALWLLVTRP